MKSLKLNFIHSRLLKIRGRKPLHYTLLTSIVLLQLLALLLWYNETIHQKQIENAFDEAQKARKIHLLPNQINGALMQSQQYFDDYIQNKNPESLQRYQLLLQQTTVMIDGLRLSAKNSEAFRELLGKKNQTQTEISELKNLIDSILKNPISKVNSSISPYKFDGVNYQKILDSVKTNTYIKVDNIAQKGLIRRLIAAFAGKVDIRKEQLNTVVTMKYKDKIITGTIEDLLKSVIINTNKHYALEVRKLQSSFMKLHQKDLQLISLNNQLLLLANQLLPEYEAAARKLEHRNQQKALSQLQTSKYIRSYGIAILILLMFVISIVLFRFTQMAFRYEKRLADARDKISRNLSFKNRIVGMISHEIRSPLQILSIYSRKIGITSQDEALKETFKSVEFTTGSLLLLANQILEYYKDEPMQLKNSKCNLSNEINQIITALTSFVESHGNKIVVHSQLKNQEMVYADVAKIHQLFYNLIGNANKFTQNGLIAININLENLSDYEYKLHVTIQDNGAGIAAQELEHLFEPHYQGATSGQHHSGIGLGLSLCKEIVTLFDGEIQIESQENKGTVVTFYLTLSKI